MDLPYASSSVTTARERVCAELTRHGASRQAVEDAALIVSELVGNALRHADPLPSGCVRLTWQIDCHQVEIAVSDGGSGSPPPGGPLAEGRGLDIVDHLADTWGVRRWDQAVTVWAVLPVAVSVCPCGSRHE